MVYSLPYIATARIDERPSALGSGVLVRFTMLPPGTALAALPQMAAFVSRFPSLFTSCKEAVNWSIFAGLLCNRTSAAISIPSQLVKTTRGALPAGSKGADKGPPDEEVW